MVVQLLLLRYGIMPVMQREDRFESGKGKFFSTFVPSRLLVAIFFILVIRRTELLEWAGFNIGCVRCSWAVLVGCFKRAGFGYIMLRLAGMH